MASSIPIYLPNPSGAQCIRVCPALTILVISRFATRSIGSPQGWESVASFWYRAGKIPHVIIDGRFAEELVPSAEVPDLSSVTLESAAESWCGLFDREFEHAAEAVAA